MVAPLLQFCELSRNWSSMVANGRKLSQRLQTVANGRNWSHRVANGHKRPQIVANARKWSQMVANGRRRLKKVVNGRKWSQLVANHSRLCLERAKSMRLKVEWIVGRGSCRSRGMWVWKSRGDGGHQGL